MLDEGRRSIGIKAFEAWRAVGMRNTVVLHTGMGKTFVGLDAACHVNTLCDGTAKIVFLAETIHREQELLKDIEFYKKCYPDAIIPEIEFACYQSSCKWKDRYYDLAICDEFHDACTPIYIKVLHNNIFRFILGLTATAGSDRTYVLDRIEISKVELMKKYLPICFTYGLTDAVRDGNSRKLNIHVIHHRLDDSEKNIQGGTIKSPFMTTEQKAYKYYDAMFWEGVYTKADYKVKNGMAKRAKLLYSLPSKFTAASHILQNIKGRTLIFANDLEALEELTDNIIRSPKEGETKKVRDAENERIRKKFESGKSKILASFKVLQQGANIKGGIDNLLIISYYSDLGKMVQRLGRLRLDGSKEGNVIIFVTIATQEEKWFKKMMIGIDTSVFNIKKHADVESYIQTLK